jgi:hypothetical protein
MYNHILIRDIDWLYIEFVNKGMYCIYRRNEPLNKQIDTALIIKVIKPEFHRINNEDIIVKIR